MGDFIHTERELLDYIDLPEVSLCSLKFCINEHNKQIDLECVFADGKGLFCENDPAIANIEISYCDDHAANYSMDGE